MDSLLCFGWSHLTHTQKNQTYYSLQIAIAILFWNEQSLSLRLSLSPNPCVSDASRIVFLTTVAAASIPYRSDRNLTFSPENFTENFFSFDLENLTSTIQFIKCIEFQYYHVKFRGS